MPRRPGQRAEPLVPEVRLAADDDVPALAAALTRSFADDPFVRWMLPGERTRPRRMDRLYRARLATILPHELTWTTPDRCGAALWTPSDAWRMPQREVLANLPVYLNRRAPLVALGWHRVEARHPHDPHLYLAILGVEPAAQGRGTGSALIGAGLERCDAEGVGAFLESSKPENVPFYERHGFRVTDRLRMPRGPRVWLMWRDPR